MPACALKFASFFFLCPPDRPIHGTLADGRLIYELLGEGAETAFARGWMTGLGIDNAMGFKDVVIEAAKARRRRPPRARAVPPLALPSAPPGRARRPVSSLPLARFAPRGCFDRLSLTTNISCLGCAPPPFNTQIALIMALLEPFVIPKMMWFESHVDVRRRCGMPTSDAALCCCFLPLLVFEHSAACLLRADGSSSLRPPRRALRVYVALPAQFLSVQATMYHGRPTSWLERMRTHIRRGGAGGYVRLLLCRLSGVPASVVVLVFTDAARRSCCFVPPPRARAVQVLRILDESLRRRRRRGMPACLPS